MALVGATMVPAMAWSSTRISMASSRVGMALHHGIFCQRTDALVGSAKVHRRARRGRGCIGTVDLDRGGPDAGEGGVGAEGFEGADLGAARAADAPRLLEHAAAPLPARVAPAGDVVVAA